MPIRLADRSVFVPSPAPDTMVLGASYYTMLSEDNGRSWSDTVELLTFEQRSDGVMREALRNGYVDPGTHRFVTFHRIARAAPSCSSWAGPSPARAGEATYTATPSR
jgi:hypothetical protein